MNRGERESRFLDNVRAGLDSETQNLDLKTTARLQGIRYSALEELDSSRNKWRKLIRLPVVVVATGIMIAVVTTVTLKSPVTLKDAQTLTDLDLLASEETLDLFADMEFYYWLAETDDHAG